MIRPSSALALRYPATLTTEVQVRYLHYLPLPTCTSYLPKVLYQHLSLSPSLRYSSFRRVSYIFPVFRLLHAAAGIHSWITSVPDRLFRGHHVCRAWHRPLSHPRPRPRQAPPHQRSASSTTTSTTTTTTSTTTTTTPSTPSTTITTTTTTTTPPPPPSPSPASNPHRLPQPLRPRTSCPSPPHPLTTPSHHLHPPPLRPFPAVRRTRTRTEALPLPLQICCSNFHRHIRIPRPRTSSPHPPHVCARIPKPYQPTAYPLTITLYISILLLLLLLLLTTATTTKGPSSDSPTTAIEAGRELWCRLTSLLRFDLSNCGEAYFSPGEEESCKYGASQHQARLESEAPYLFLLLLCCST